ncbi:Histamine H2 receptor [Stylophora pistillata]|uniref:Histamine H2 receptor n=1 Tax=Stylophora pistillata TaxID=50429 RepID=A0A2B4S7F9_STYPI|nr:Histamine H2 receptor [Stylophora pistillata]
MRDPGNEVEGELLNYVLCPVKKTICIHKYVGVVQPSKRKIFTRKTVLMAVAWVWLQALLTALTPILGWNSYEYIQGRTQCSVKVPRENKLNELTNCLFIITCGFVIPLAIMNFSYFKIFRTVKIHTKRVRSHSFGEEKSAAFLNERRIIVTLFIILAVFLACWTPFSVLTIYATLVGHELPKYYSVAAYWMGFLNSAMNPLIYALRTKEFRQGYQQIFSMLLPCCLAKPSSEENDSRAVLRGRRSLKSDVMTFTRRRAGTVSENQLDEIHDVAVNGTTKVAGRKNTLEEVLEDKSDGAKCEFPLRSKEMRGIHESCFPAQDFSSSLDNPEKIRDRESLNSDETNSNEIPGCSEALHDDLFQTRESLLLWNSTDFLLEKASNKNSGEDEKSRRKSFSFLPVTQQKHKLKSRHLYRSKSDCSVFFQTPNDERSFMSARVEYP